MIIRLFLIALMTLPVVSIAANNDPVSLSPTLASSPINVSSILQVLSVLLIIIFIIIFISWLYKKYGLVNGSMGSNFRVVSAISLGGKEKAVILKVGDEQILVGVSPGYVRKLHVLNKIIEESSDGDSVLNADNTFISKLNKEISKVISK